MRKSVGVDDEALDDYQELNVKEKQNIEIKKKVGNEQSLMLGPLKKGCPTNCKLLGEGNTQSIVVSDKQVSIQMKFLDKGLKEVDQIEVW